MGANLAWPEFLEITLARYYKNKLHSTLIFPRNQIPALRWVLVRLRILLIHLEGLLDINISI